MCPELGWTDLDALDACFGKVCGNFLCVLFFYTFFYMKSLENDVSSASIAGQRPDASTVQCVVAVSMCPEK